MFEPGAQISPPINRQYARIVDGSVQEIGLDPAAYGTHTMRRTKATLMYRRCRVWSVFMILGRSMDS